MKFGFVLLFNTLTHTRKFLCTNISGKCLLKCLKRCVNRRAAHTLTGVSCVWQSGNGWNFQLFWDFFPWVWKCPFFGLCGVFCCWSKLLHTGDLTHMKSSAVPPLLLLSHKQGESPLMLLLFFGQGCNHTRVWFWAVGRSCPCTLILMSDWQ